MAVLEILFRLVGVFYLLGSVVGARRVVFDATIDRAINAIGMTREKPAETTKRRLLVIGIVLIGMSGTALAAMSLWAVPLFALTTASHLHLMVWQRRNDPPEDSGDAADRTRSARATIAFAAIGAGVLFLASRGSLAPFAQPSRAAAIAATGIVLAAILARGLLWTGKRKSFGDFDGAYEDEQVDSVVDFDPDEPPQYEFRASADAYPLYEHVRDTVVYHHHILSADLAVRLSDWNAAVLQLGDEGVPAPHDLPAGLLEEARALLGEMEAEIGQTIACKYRPGAMEWAREHGAGA